MKKRILATLITMTVVISMTACGSADNSNADVSEENVVSEVPETTNTEEIVVETETEEVDTRLEDGMAKIDRLFQAHTDLLAPHKILPDSLQYDVESIQATCINDGQISAGDGKVFKAFNSIAATLINYYDNYVNNNGSYYDIGEWLKSQPDEETIMSSIQGLHQDSYNTNDILLMEAIGVIAYMKNCETVVGTEVIDSTDYVISGVTSAYIIPLDCDDDTALTAVFDGEGNLLNICTPADGSWNNYISSFPEQ